MDNQIVSVTKTVSVYPKSLHPETLLSLSNLDRQCPMLMYIVFFYKNDISVKLPFFDNLKTALEETLLVWYPAAGRLKLNPSDGKLDLLCNNAGAVLVEAVAQVGIPELGELSQYNEFCEDLVFKPVFQGDFSEMPLVVAQVTKFGCGGYAVGIGTSHSLFDGPSTFKFLTSWASRTAMRGDGKLELHVPLHERGQLLVGKHQTQSQDMNNSSTTTPSVAAFDHLHQLIKQAASDRILDPDGELNVCKVSETGYSNNKKYISGTFHVSDAMIEGLKMKVCSGEKGSTRGCSSFEVLAAHLWRARTKALGLEMERMVCLQFSMDTRNNKNAPPLPREFSGNAYVLASITCTAGILEKKDLPTIVHEIKRAKKSVNEDYINAYLEALEAPQPTTLPPLRELTLVSDRTRTPFHKIDFGYGEATYASPLIPPVPQVIYFMQNPIKIDSSSIDVRIGLLPQDLDAFSHYFFTNM